MVPDNTVHQTLLQPLSASGSLQTGRSGPWQHSPHTTIYYNHRQRADLSKLVEVVPDNTAHTPLYYNHRQRADLSKLVGVVPDNTVHSPHTTIYYNHRQRADLSKLVDVVPDNTVHTPHYNSSTSALPDLVCLPQLCLTSSAYLSSIWPRLPTSAPSDLVCPPQLYLTSSAHLWPRLPTSALSLISSAHLSSLSDLVCLPQRSLTSSAYLSSLSDLVCLPQLCLTSFAYRSSAWPRLPTSALSDLVCLPRLPTSALPDLVCLPQLSLTSTAYLVCLPRLPTSALPDLICLPQLALSDLVAEVAHVERGDALVLGCVQRWHRRVPVHQFLSDRVVHPEVAVLDVLVGERVIGVGRLLVSEAVRGHYTLQASARKNSYGDDFNTNLDVEPLFFRFKIV